MRASLLPSLAMRLRHDVILGVIVKKCWFSFRITDANADEIKLSLLINVEIIEQFQQQYAQFHIAEGFSYKSTNTF